MEKFEIMNNEEIEIIKEMINSDIRYLETHLAAWEDTPIGTAMKRYLKNLQKIRDILQEEYPELPFA